MTLYSHLHSSGDSTPAPNNDTKPAPDTDSNMGTNPVVNPATANAHRGREDELDRRADNVFQDDSGDDSSESLLGTSVNIYIYISSKSGRRAGKGRMSE